MVSFYTVTISQFEKSSKNHDKHMPNYFGDEPNDNVNAGEEQPTAEGLADAV